MNERGWDNTDCNSKETSELGVNWGNTWHNDLVSTANLGKSSHRFYL